jgi:hypothetical protein
MVNQLRQTNRFDRATLLGASRHPHGGAHEVAEVFVDVLEHAATHLGTGVAVVGSGPAPYPPGPEYGFTPVALCRRHRPGWGAA